MSSQEINTHKYKLFMSIKTLEDLEATLSKPFDIPLTNDLGIYLGMPMVHGRKTQKLFSFIVAKVQKKLGW